jgi:hypothetical protein
MVVSFSVQVQFPTLKAFDHTIFLWGQERPKGSLTFTFLTLLILLKFCGWSLGIFCDWNNHKCPWSVVLKDTLSLYGTVIKATQRKQTFRTAEYGQGPKHFLSHPPSPYSQNVFWLGFGIEETPCTLHFSTMSVGQTTLLLSPITLSLSDTAGVLKSCQNFKRACRLGMH